MAQESRVKTFNAGPNQTKAILSKARYTVIKGPRGEGKSAVTWMACAYHARWVGQVAPQYLPIPVAVIRDTKRNIGRTVVKTIKHWWPPGFGSTWRGKEMEPEWAMIYDTGGTKLLECYFFGCDSDNDLNAFQSFECGIQVYEEPAAASTVSGGIAPQVFAVGITSLRSNPYPKVYVPMNPPNRSQWPVQLWPDLLPAGVEPPMVTDPVVEEARKRVRDDSLVINIPKGENKALDEIAPGYREANRDMLMAMGRMDLVGRLVEGEVGEVELGIAVTPEFSESLHVVDAVPPIKPGDSLLMAWDNPPGCACVVFRVGEAFCDVVKAWVEVGLGMDEFLGRIVKPWIQMLPQGVRWRHVGDPNLKTSSTTDSSKSALKSLIRELPGPFVPGPISEDDREQSAKRLLTRPLVVGGKAWLRIDKHGCDKLITALHTGWHRPRDKTGEMRQVSWTKNQFANVGEAFAYGAWWLLETRPATDQQEPWRKKVALQQAAIQVRGTRTRV